MMRATVSLGSNVGSREIFLESALARLCELPKTRLVVASKVRETEPVDVPGEFAALKFLNQAAIFETELDVDDFSRRMHAVEDSLGRVRSVRNGPRTIDIDLIFFGDLTVSREDLTLPHPRFAEREFVMEPLRELWLGELRRYYDSYVAGYRDANGRLPEMMQLKYEHTMAVVRNAEEIAAGEGFSGAHRFVSLAAALLHDTGRYEQLRLYNSFKDSETVDHAVFSHDIVRRENWLGKAIGSVWSRAEQNVAAILKAILYHNRRELPSGLDPLAEVTAHAVRDADKLDIFRVLEDRVRHSDWRRDSRAFWNLQVGIAPNPSVVDAIRKGMPVDYQEIRSLADFVLIQIGWMISGLHFRTSRQKCAARGHLAFRREFLREIGGGEIAEGLCNLAEEVMR